MIYNSYIWKNAILKKVEEMNAINLSEEDIDENMLDILEFNIMSSAFYYRKLMDSNKLTDTCDTYNFKVKSFKCIKEPNIMNSHKIDKYYNLDLNKAENIQINSRILAGIIIHSFCFEFLMDENNKVKGFFLNSDKNKDISLYYISFDQYFEFLKKVSRDWATSIELEYDSKNCKYKYNYKK